MRHLRWCLVCLLLLARFARGEELRVLLSPLPPLIVTEVADGAVSGPAIDLLEHIAALGGLSFRIESYPASRAFLLARGAGNACLISARVAEREALFKWSHPLMPFRLILFESGLDARSFSDVDAARRSRIGAVRGSAVASRLSREGWVLDESADAVSSLKKLQAGRIDLFASLDVGMRQMTDALGMLPLKPALVVDKMDIYFACNLALDARIFERLNEGIAAAGRDGSLQRFEKAPR